MKTFPVFVISLPHRIDRRTDLVENWRERGLSVEFEWVEGIRPEPEDIRWTEIKGMEAYGRDANLRKSYVIGAVGCKRAGISALDRFLETEQEWGLICQDDCRWSEGAAEAMDDALVNLPEDADMLYFSGHSRRANEVVSDRLVRLGGARNCTAILFRRGYVMEMLPRLAACDCEWDLFMEREHATARAYCVVPMPAYQARSFSDIVQRVVEPPNRG
jgi:GR25 family glycosyltransferase involved in LPS biosynthesis